MYDGCRIDVVIGTHNRHDNLTETLKAFKQLKKTEKEIRVVVIDSSDKELKKEFQKLCDVYIYNKEAKPLAIKRNIGIKKSTAEFVIFTDDDCIPKQNWISEIMTTFKKYDCICVTGRTVPYKKYGESEYEKKFSFDRLGMRERKIRGYFEFGIKIINMSRIGHGNNMAFKRNIFDEAGFFDEELGVGSKNLAGEDADMFYRIYKKNKLIIYNPKAIIYHKHLLKKEDILRTAYRNAFSYRNLFLKHHDFNCIVSYLYGFSRSLVRFVIYSLLVNNFKMKLNQNQLRGWLAMKEK